MFYRIYRPFPSPNVLRVGQIVDASTWRNRLLLERTGYIKALTPDELEGMGGNDDTPQVPDSPTKSEDIQDSSKTESEVSPEADSGADESSQPDLLDSVNREDPFQAATAPATAPAQLPDNKQAQPKTAKPQRAKSKK